MKIGRYDALSVDKIIEVYTLKRMGANDSEVREKTGVSNPYQVMKSVQKLLDGGRVSKRNAHYKGAIQILENQGNISAIVTPVDPWKKTQSQPLPDTRYDRMQRAFDAFTTAITEFVEAEVTSKVEDTRKELEEQKKINEKLKSAFDEARHSNWITNLKRKFS